MVDHRKSDEVVVPEKRPNNAQGGAAEAVEGRTSTEGNTGEQAMLRAQNRSFGMPSGLERVREAAMRDRQLKFTTLLHHVDEPALMRAFRTMNRDAAAGVDGVTWSQYAEGVEGRLKDLCSRIHRGAYRPQPSRRTFIPKEDGSRRALGIAALEDKIVQGAVVAVLSAIYEGDFLGFSYGFRPGRGQHDALDALNVGIQTRKVNYVLDADIRGYFDTIDHAILLKILQDRVSDPRMLRLIERWLKAGVMENEQWNANEAGTPQGATISPLLANIYLHHVLDTWTDAWRKKARGDVIIVRYADDFIVGFQHEQDAKEYQAALSARLREHGLELHPDKTRLIEFGRFAHERRARRGLPRPETFDFLGFTHICEKCPGGFWIKRVPAKKRVRAKLRRLKEILRRTMHRPVDRVGSWLGSVLRGYFAYFAVPGALVVLERMRHIVGYIWFRVLRRRDQRRQLNWQRMRSLVDRWLPRPTLMHPLPIARFSSRTRGRSPVR
jgi:group II intron reverse transcriptase/maturase